MSYRLICMAHDGDFVHEGGEFDTIEDAWARNEDMGSRWIFYTVRFVTGASMSDLARVVDACHGAECMEGRSLRMIARIFSQEQAQVIGHIEGKNPLYL